MNFNFTRQVVSLAFRFYSRALTFPYDELTHELLHLFREVEKNIETDIDNTIASKILDILNFYQGEEMNILHGEFARLFSYIRNEDPFVSMRLSELNPNLNQIMLTDRLLNSTDILDVEDAQDALPNVLDLFSSVIEIEEENSIEDFFLNFITDTVPVFCEQIYRATNLAYYKEVAKGLNELVYLLKD